jgi:hypothetical protein
VAQVGSKRPTSFRVAVIAGLVLAVTAAATAVSVAQPAPWRIVQSGDGSLYLLAAGQRFSLEPDPIGDDELAAFADGGDLGSSLPSPASGLGAPPVPTGAPEKLASDSGLPLGPG